MCMYRVHGIPFDNRHRKIMRLETKNRLSLGIVLVADRGVALVGMFGTCLA